MVFKRFWIITIAYVVAIVVLALCFAFFVTYTPLYSLVFLFLLGLTSLALIRWVNSTNEKLAFFFTAVKNDDTSFRFPENSGFLKEKEFHKSLNQLNEKIKNTRLSIEVQERFYKSLMENVMTGIISFDLKGFVEYANPALLRLFGLENISHISRLGKQEPRLPELLMNIAPGENRWINIRSGQKLLSLAIQAQTFVLQPKDLKIVTMQDIKNELDYQEMESWQKLIRILNHEIMNSVTPITSLSSTISDLYKNNGKEIDPGLVTQRIIGDTVKGLNIIAEHGKGLISFVESYRSLTLLPNPEFNNVCISDFLESVVILANSYFTTELADPGKRPQIRTSVVPEDLSIMADDKMLARVLLNLIKNSTESDVEGRTISIEIKAFRNNEARPVIIVKDNGPGMEPEVLENIFVPFYTTKKTGSGIGLSLSREILRMHNATITCTSSSGSGTVFTIRF